MLAHKSFQKHRQGRLGSGYPPWGSKS